jgi:hypothetical protein
MSIGGTASRKITGQEIMNASKLNVGSTPIVSGTVGRLLFQGTGDILQQSSSLFWDSTNNRLGIGTETPTQSLHVVGNALFTGSPLIYLGNTDNYLANTSGVLQLYSSTNTIRIRQAGSNPIRIALSGAGSFFSVSDGSSDDTFIVRKNGNVQIGTITDAGFKLDVNGTARVATSLNTPAVFSTGGPLSLYGGFTNRGRIDIFNNTTGLAIDFQGNGSSRMQLHSNGNVLINTTTDDGFRLDVNGTARVQSKLTIGNSTASPYQLNVWGGATESYISLNNTNSGALNAEGFQIGLEANGTDVYFINRENGFIQFRTNNLDRFRVTNTGNVLINTTTDAGFRLDVNGTARVSGAITAQLSDNAGSNSNLLVQTINGDASVFRVQNNEGFALITTNNGVSNFTNNSYAFSIQNGFRISQSSGGLGPAASAILDVVSTTQGFLPPRMTNAQRTAIVSPAVGLIVYCTDVTEGLWVYKSLGWTFIV